MISKSKLIGKYVLYMDKNGKFSQGKVTKILGKTLTIRDAYKERHRLHPDKVKIFGAFKTTKIRGKSMSEYLEEIKW
jgi:ribosomal protein L35AE/L33A